MPSGSGRAFKLGDFECRILFDGSRSIGSMTSGSAHRFIFGDAPEAELDRCLGRLGVVDASTQIPFNYLLVDGGGHITLVDVGCGEQAENDKNPKEPAGLLLESLAKSGYSAVDVDKVIVSHCHWDHFGGAVASGRPVFPKAEYVMSRGEAEHIRVKVKGWALDYLHALGDRLRLTPDSAEVCPGVSIRVVSGHTPGIAVTEINSGGETLLYTSDLILHRAHVEHFDWIPSFETDKAAATAGRGRLVEDACARKLLLFVPHIPTVLGRVTKRRGGYRWVDEA